MSESSPHGAAVECDCCGVVLETCPFLGADHRLRTLYEMRLDPWRHVIPGISECNEARVGVVLLRLTVCAVWR
jgi:hypothetical protein